MQDWTALPNRPDEIAWLAQAAESPRKLLSLDEASAILEGWRKPTTACAQTPQADTPCQAGAPCQPQAVDIAVTGLVLLLSVFLMLVATSFIRHEGDSTGHSLAVLIGLGCRH